MAYGQFVEAEAALADAAGMFYDPLGPRLERFAHLIEPHLAALDVSFDRRLKTSRAPGSTMRRNGRRYFRSRPGRRRRFSPAAVRWPISSNKWPTIAGVWPS